MARHQSQALSPGTVVGRYEIQEPLGMGGFGVTYMAVDQKLGRRVALKEYMPVELSVRANDGRSVVPRGAENRDDYDFCLRKFLDEAKILARCDDVPNVVSVIDHFEANGTAYIVMRYEDGRPLEQLLDERSTPLTESELRDDLLTPLLQSLTTVHNNGVLHRDIKPSNVYIRKDGMPILIDFGAARNTFWDQTKSLAAATVGFAPIEQVQRGTSDQGPWTDLYAVGGTAYYCLGKKVPVDAVRRLMDVSAGKPDPLPPPAGPPGTSYSPELLHVISWMLEIRPEQRPQSAGQVLDALSKDPVGDRSTDPELTVAATRWDPQSGVSPPGVVKSPLRRRRVIIPAAIAILAGALWYGFGGLPGGPLPEPDSGMGGRVDAPPHIISASAPPSEAITASAPASAPPPAAAADKPSSDAKTGPASTSDVKEFLAALSVDTADSTTTASEPDAQSLSPAEQARVAEWLRAAKTFAENSNYITPPKKNAVYAFSKVLEINPGNTIARDGLAKIANVYEQAGRTMLKQGRIDLGRAIARHGLGVKADHAGLLQLTRQQSGR